MGLAKNQVGYLRIADAVCTGGNVSELRIHQTTRILLYDFSVYALGLFVARLVVADTKKISIGLANGVKSLCCWEF